MRCVLLTSLAWIVAGGLLLTAVSITDAWLVKRLGRL